MRRRLGILFVALISCLAPAGCGGSDEPDTPEDQTAQSLAQSAKDACRDTGRAPATVYGLRRQGASLRVAYSGTNVSWPCSVVVLPSPDGLEVSVNRSVPSKGAPGERVAWCVDATLPARVSRRRLEVAVRREPSKAERSELSDLLASQENCIPTPLRLINLG